MDIGSEVLDAADLALAHKALSELDELVEEILERNMGDLESADTRARVARGIVATIINRMSEPQEKDI